MERGSKYEAYANLRESRLRMKQTKNPSPENQDSVNNLIPSKNPVKFQGQKSFHAGNRVKGASLYAHSAPILLSNTRNENRKQVLPSPAEKKATPARKNCSKLNAINSRLGGCKSSAPAEKRKTGIFTAIRSSRRAMQTWMK